MITWGVDCVPLCLGRSWTAAASLAGWPARHLAVKTLDLEKEQTCHFCARMVFKEPEFNRNHNTIPPEGGPGCLSQGGKVRKYSFALEFTFEPNNSKNWVHFYAPPFSMAEHIVLPISVRPDLLSAQ